jgi:hypothetical protein
MHFDGWNTIEGRHLVFAYVAVILIQGGYFAWIVLSWLKLDADAKKATKPIGRPASLSEEYRR